MSLNIDPTKALMNELAAELKRVRPNQKRVEQLSARLDKLLGTTLKPENRKEAQRWERARREEQHDRDD